MKRMTRNIDQVMAGLGRNQIQVMQQLRACRQPQWHHLSETVREIDTMCRREESVEREPATRSRTK